MSAEHDLTDLCAAFDVTRSGYHAWQAAEPSARELADAALRLRIRTLHAQHRGRYGAPRLRTALAQQGQRHGTKRIARLMRQDGLRGLCPKRFVPRTTDSTHDQPLAPNRLAETRPPTGPNQVWVSDLTYVATQEGWLYVAVILDLGSRRVVGWSTGPSLKRGLVLAALQMALQHRRPAPGLLHHSDRGVQYASADHRRTLAAAGAEVSMSRAGNPYDNAAMESFMATYKRECVGLAEDAGGYAKRAAATADFFEYAEAYYNRERSHSALGYQSPVDFENQLNQKTTMRSAPPGCPSNRVNPTTSARSDSVTVLATIAARSTETSKRHLCGPCTANSKQTFSYNHENKHPSHSVSRRRTGVAGRPFDSTHSTSNTQQSAD